MGGEGLRLLQHKRRIHQVKRLLRHGGLKALRRAHVRAGEVERAEHRGEVLAVNVSVGCAPRGEGLRGQVHGQAAGREVELAGREQERVAELLEVEALAVELPEQRVRGVGLHALGTVVAGLLVGRGQHDDLVQLLDAPAVGDKTRRQPVEQLGMRRRVGAHAEIAGRADEARAEVPGPDTVH